MKTDLSAIKGILWDLDNTLYPSTQAVYDSFNQAIARAAIASGVDLSFEEATALASRSFEENRYSGLVFIQKYNIPFVDLHWLTDQYLDHSVVAVCAETESVFSRTTHDHALITHASSNWAINVLNRLGLKKCFPDERIFGFENYDFESKARSRRPFEMALASINLNPQDVVMVEDTVENLRVPHEMGMTTILVHHGQVPQDLPDYVDIHCQNARTVMARFYSSASG
jgi:putative hydrolase of the HAD superfamily